MNTSTCTPTVQRSDFQDKIVIKKLKSQVVNDAQFC